jgi:hypothetical protein
MLLREIAHARAGDKGNISNISVIAYDPADYPRLEQYVTAERVKAHFADIAAGEVQRFTLPALGALNFVLHNALTGGVTRSLALDAHGKTLGSAILSLDIPEPGSPTELAPIR